MASPNPFEPQFGLQSRIAEVAARGMRIAKYMAISFAIAVVGAIFIGAAVGIVNLMPAIFIGMLLAGLFSAALLLMRRAGWPGVPEYISYGTFLCIGALDYLLARGL